MTAFTPLLRRAGKLARLLRNPLYRRGLRHRTAAAVEALPLLRGLSPGSILDVGANRGQFALSAKHCFPDVRLHAFEPLPQAADAFEALFSGLASVTLHRVAVGAEAGTADLHVSGRADCSSLLPIGAAQRRAAPGSGEVDRLHVPVVAMDGFAALADLPLPALLKIDVQGTELAVLKGAERLLSTVVEWVLVEVSFVALYEDQPLAAEVVRFLHDRGFGLTGMGPPWIGPNGTCLQADLLFSRLAPIARGVR